MKHAVNTENSFVPLKTVSLLSKREIAKVPRLRRPALRRRLRQGKGFGGQEPPKTQ